MSNIRSISRNTPSGITPCFETEAWLLFKVLYRACEFENQDEAAAYLGMSLRTVQRTWARKAAVRGRDLMALRSRATARGFVVAQADARAA